MPCEFNISANLKEYLELPKSDTHVNRIIGGLALTNNVASIQVIETPGSSPQLHLVAVCKDASSRGQQAIFHDVKEDIQVLNSAIKSTPEVVLHSFRDKEGEKNPIEELAEIPDDSRLLFSASIL